MAHVWIQRRETMAIPENGHWFLSFEIRSRMHIQFDWCRIVIDQAMMTNWPSAKQKSTSSSVEP